jgi:hypothetical protein
MYALHVKATAGTLIRTQPLDVTDFGPNFTQAVTPTTQNVNAGASVPYSVTYTPLGGMTDDITVSCGALPANVACTPVPAVVNPGKGYHSIVTLATTFGPPLAAANDTIAIIGTSAPVNVTRSTSVALSVKDFSVTANTATVATNLGVNISDTILVKGLNGFIGNIPLSCAIVGTPAGMGCTLSNVNPAATSTGTSVTATITSTAATTPFGSYTVQVTGTTLAGSHTGQFTVNIKDFALGIAPTTQQILATGSTVFADYILTATALNSFSSGVTLTCITPLPTGVTCGFGSTHTSSMTVVPTALGASVPFRIAVSSSVAPNEYDLNIRGASGALIRLQPVTLELQ